MVLNIILSIVANGLTSLFGHLSHKTGELLIGKDFLEKWELEKTALLPILQNTPHTVAESFQWQGPPTLEETYAFLHSPEVESIVRQIFSMKLSEDKKRLGLESIRKEFLASFSLYTGFEKDQLAEVATLLFDTLLEGCDLALTKAIDKGKLSAHEAKSVFRQRIILDQLATINKNLALLSSKQKLNVQDILEYEQKYRQQIANRHSYITPPDFNTVRRVPIDNLYVFPSFVTIPNKNEELDKNEEPELLDMDKFLSRVYRAVLLGNPGGGKSTLSLKLCYDLATRYSLQSFAGRTNVTPILVVLRNYGVDKKDHNCSILEFIEAEAKANYQLPEPPPGTFEYLLLNGRVIVIFDGLDELLETSYRQEISNDVESFCNLYPSVPVLVTSRLIGYEQAPLDEKIFETFRLAPFDGNQVQEYVEKWFSVAYTDLKPKQQHSKVKAFLKESRIVPDLCSNPLMLALMCNIYRGENYFPKNRPDIYEKCATMLFDRWDRHRDIHVSLPFDAHISPAMKYLAHWIYTDERLRAGVTEKKLIEKTTQYLSQKRFDDRDEAEKAAREFIEFCRGRAWVFTDVGTTKEGERLYQFTHQTFLEYFTAAYLVRTNPTPSTLLNILQPRIAKREWDVVASLAFQIQNKNSEDAGDELLTTLIEQANEIEGDEGWNLLSFAATCLSFIIPSPRVIRSIVKAYIDRPLIFGLKLISGTEVSRSDQGKFDYDKLKDLFEILLSITNENRKAISDNLKDLLIEEFKTGSEDAAVLILEISMMSLIRSDYIFDACPDRMKLLCPKYLLVCNRAFWHGKVCIADFIKWHDIENFFRVCFHTIRSTSYSLPPASLIAKIMLNLDLSERLKKFLRDMGMILASHPLPWIKQKELYDFMLAFPDQLIDMTFEPSERIKGEHLNLDADLLFGAFVLFAVLLEIQEPSEDLIYFKVIKTCNLPMLTFIHRVLIARFEPTQSDKVQAEMDICKFTTEQQEFLWKWIRREHSFVQS